MIDFKGFCVYLKKDFGAKGDGETDDTSSVHDFLNHLAKNGGIGIVEPGVYNSGSYRLNNNNISFSVTGSSPVDCLFKNLSSGSFFTFKRCSGIRIDGISIDCQYTKTRTKMHGLILSPAQIVLLTIAIFMITLAQALLLIVIVKRSVKISL